MKHIKCAGLALGALVATGWLVACTNGFEKFYRADPNADVVRAQPTTLPPPTQPKLYSHTADMQADGLHLMEAGYIFIGESSFYGPSNQTNMSQALAQGKKVGAALIMVKSAYMDTVSGVMPFTTVNPPVVSTVNTSGTVNYMGSGGYATGNYNGSGTITTPGGTTTNYIPYSVTRNTYYASYWIQQDASRMHLGIQFNDLPDDLRKRLERNTGVIVRVVVHGTPAFIANVFEGDVITKVSGENVVETKQLSNLLAAHTGQHIELEILRGDRTLTIPVDLH